MRVFIYRISSPEPQELNLDADVTLGALKKLLMKSATEAAGRVRLIHGGLVLQDSSRLSELACGPGPLVLWLMRESIGEAMQVVTSAENLGVFPLSWQQPCQLQKADVSDFLSVLHAFRKSLAAFTTTIGSDTAPINEYMREGKGALDRAIAALECPTPMFSSVPRVEWFGEYGCALLASEHRLGVVQLRLVGLD